MSRNRMATLTMMLAAALVAWSCGDAGRSPVGYTDMTAGVATLDALPAAGTLVFTSKALRAAKRGTWDGTVVSERDIERIDNAQGGQLSVRFSNYIDKKKAQIQVQQAKFEVLPGSISPVEPTADGTHTIKMRVWSGSSLDDVLVEFWPHGMEFRPGATLKIQLRGEYDGDEIVGYHIEPDGTITQVATTVEKKKGTFALKIAVPGFSEYSWDDGDDTDIDPTMEDGSCWGCNGSPH